MKLSSASSRRVPVVTVSLVTKYIKFLIYVNAHGFSDLNQSTPISFDIFFNFVATQDYLKVEIAFIL